MENNKLILRVSNNSTYVEGRLSSAIYDKFKRELGYVPENSFWMIKNNSEKAEGHEKWKTEWDGNISAVCWNKQFCHCYIKKVGLHFPTGLLSKAVNFFNANNVDFKRIDIRNKTNKTDIYAMSEEFEFRDYQQNIIDKVVGTKQSPGIDRGIIKAATGSGKTALASGIIAGIGVSPTIFYVPSIDLLKQAKDELEKFIRHNNLGINVGMIGGGSKDIQDINVMTIQTAVRSLGGVWVKFDDEDSTKEDMNIDDIKEDVKNLIKDSRLMICDECLDGDSLIKTEKGYVKISKVLELNCKYVLSYDGNKKVWKKIISFSSKGKRKVLKITLNSGKQIKCTSNHPFMTKKGWVESGKLHIGSEVFVCEQEKNGNKNIKRLLKIPLSVNAVAGKRLNQNIRPSNYSLNIEELKNIDNIFTDMINAQKIGILSCQNMNNKQFWEHYWEILVCPYLFLEELIQDYVVIMELNKVHGRHIKQVKYQFYLLNYLKLLIMVMEKNLCVYALVVIHLLKKYMRLLILMEENKLALNGLIISGMLDWRGGYAMTEVEEEIILDYIQKDFKSLKLILFSHGFGENLEKLVSINLKSNTIQSVFLKNLCRKYRLLLKNISQNVCSTNFETVTSIEEDGDSNVFDIEVEDTHCFFANDILVHNCQHWAAETCQIISDASSSCQYRYGISATPYRDQGDDVLIEGCFGKTIVDISASFLIKKGYLVKPIIHFLKMNNMRGLRKSAYGSIYNQAIVENFERNNKIAEIANRFFNGGRKTLILVKQIKHGKMLEDLIPESVFIYGGTAKKKRTSHLDKMREGLPQITIASVIFDEGIDVRPLDTLILAGSGKSPTRALQRIGRILRPYEGKKEAIAVDFMDNCKYMQAHSNKRLSIYKTEEEFEIIGE